MVAFLWGVSWAHIHGHIFTAPCYYIYSVRIYTEHMSQYMCKSDKLIRKKKVEKKRKS